MKKEEVLTNEIINAGSEVLVLKAKAETIKPIIQEIQERILKENIFNISKKWELDSKKRNYTEEKRILTENRAYLMNDEDFKKYYNLCYEEYIKAGFKIEYETCPYLIAHHELIQAENRLIKEVSKIFKFDSNLIYGDKREQILDLTLSLICSEINTKNLNLN